MPVNLIFDFGGVLVDWDPRAVYVPYFGDAAKAEWFLSHICTYDWNAQVDAGLTTAEITEARVAEFPEWEKEIRLYYDRWTDMLRGEVPGMLSLVRDYKERGCGIWGLTNWSRELFPLVRDRFPVFKLMDGIVVSGVEKVIKPDPALYRILLDRYGLKAEDCVFIDDKADNVAGAEAVGIHGILFEGELSLREKLDALLAEKG